MLRFCARLTRYQGAMIAPALSSVPSVPSVVSQARAKSPAAPRKLHGRRQQEFGITAAAAFAAHDDGGLATRKQQRRRSVGAARCRGNGCAPSHRRCCRGVRPFRAPRPRWASPRMIGVTPVLASDLVAAPLPAPFVASRSAYSARPEPLARSSFGVSSAAAGCIAQAHRRRRIDRNIFPVWRAPRRRVDGSATVVPLSRSRWARRVARRKWPR